MTAVNTRTVPCLLLALFILALTGAGNVLTVSMLGLLLCAAGLMRQSAQVDWWIFLPLVGYNLVSMAASWRVYGNITDGYGSIQLIFPALYLLAACLDSRELLLLKRLCVVWAAGAAAAGILQFAGRALDGGAQRLSGLLGNPNAMGIFLAAGWFALLDLQLSKKERRLFAALEPVLLIALALTLSMGSMLSMAVGILFLAAEKKRAAPWRDTAAYACALLARVSFGIGTGILVYLAAARTDAPWVCVLVLLYGLAAAALWERLRAFLDACPFMAAVMTGLGTLAALALVLLRPSAVETFQERLEMIRCAADYLFVHPLGVGPYQWRQLDLRDGGTYFNTWHIHNIPVHIAVEMGWFALAALAVVPLRFFRKKRTPASRAGFAAFLFHNLLDTSFFYTGVTAFALLTAYAPPQKGRLCSTRVLRLLFACFGAVFAWNLFCRLTAG